MRCTPAWCAIVLASSRFVDCNRQFSSAGSIKFSTSDLGRKLRTKPQVVSNSPSLVVFKPLSKIFFQSLLQYQQKIRSNKPSPPSRRAALSRMSCDSPVAASSWEICRLHWRLSEPSLRALRWRRPPRLRQEGSSPDAAKGNARYLWCFFP